VRTDPHFLSENKKSRIRRRVKYWEIIANNLGKAGWTWDVHLKLMRPVACFSKETRTGGDGKRFIVRADEKPTALLKPQESHAMTVIEFKPHRNG
jgi:hypothetical protein